MLEKTSANLRQQDGEDMRGRQRVTDCVETQIARTKSATRAYVSCRAVSGRAAW